MRQIIHKGQHAYEIKGKKKGAVNNDPTGKVRKSVSPTDRVQPQRAEFFLGHDKRMSNKKKGTIPQIHLSF